MIRLGLAALALVGGVLGYKKYKNDKDEHETISDDASKVEDNKQTRKRDALGHFVKNDTGG